MTVLFASDNSLERAENLRAVWDAYDGPKEFMRGARNIAGVSGYPVVVCDTLTPLVGGKDFAIVNIGHAVTGGKVYGLGEQRPGIDPLALAQTDYAVSSGTEVTGITASHYGIPEDRALPLGTPRTDAYAGKCKGDGGTPLARFDRAYLYAPTLRSPHDGGRLPDIDWRAIDSMMGDDEILAVKRHYWTGGSIVGARLDHIVELPCDEPSAGYLMDCDALLTDYSSIMFDAQLLGKPVVLATDDADEYLRNRGMYLEYPDSYSRRHLRVEGSPAGMLAILREAAENGMSQSELDCIAHVADRCDGHAAERVCDLIGRLT